MGFSAETENLIKNTGKKRSEKHLDLIVANNVGDPAIGFDSDQNEITVLGHQLNISFPKSSKKTLARKLIEIIAEKSLESIAYE